MTQTSQSSDSSRFNGFTLPDGAWLPPELLYLLPLLSKSQLKVTIAVIYHYTRVGGSETLTLDEIQNLTGLTRSITISAITWLLGENEHGLQVLERRQLDRSYTYRPRLDLHESPKIRLSATTRVRKSVSQPEDESENQTHLSEKERESERKLIKESLKALKTDSLSDSLTDSTSLPEIRLALLQELRAAGVYLKTAQGLVNSYPADRIREKMSYFPYALGIGFANGPGWLVAAIKEDWPAPLGYDPHEKRTYRQTEQVDLVCPDCHTYPCVCEVVCGQCCESPCVCEGVAVPVFEGPARISRGWEAAKGQLEAEIPQAAFDTWVRDIWLASFDEEAAELVVGTRNAYARDWLESRLSSSLTRLLIGTLNQSVSVRFEVGV